MPVSQVSRRKRLGAWYTPPALVDAVVAALDLRSVLDACGSAPVRVLDPACGDGRFLFAVRAAVERLGGRVELTGVDIDPGAPVFATSGGRWIWGDARSMPELALASTPRPTWSAAGPFDVVVGNPPFLNQLASATTRGGRSHLGGGPYADTAAEFLALAVTLLRPGGRLGMVLPQPLLSARDGASIRAEVDRRAALRWVWWSATPVFDAAVHTWAGVWELGGAPAPVERSVGPTFVPARTLPRPPAASPAPTIPAAVVLLPTTSTTASLPSTAKSPPLSPLPSTTFSTASWSWLISGVDGPDIDVDVDIDGRGPRLGSIAAFLVDFRDSYYGLVGAVGDDVDGPPLITSGLIEPGRCLWGERPARFAKQRHTAPRVDVARLTPAMQRWAAQRLVPKILIANQTRVIEAVHDPGGMWLPSVPVLTCTSDDPERVLAVLGSDPAVRWVHRQAAGSGLGAHTVRLSPSLLASIPLR
ncbi:MAG: N-6 DNA methylase [Ilumatobacteraceae bacterium]